MELVNDILTDLFKICNEETHAKLRQLSTYSSDLSKRVFKYSYSDIKNITYYRLILTYKQKNNYNWNDGLEGACKGGNLDIINLMIEKGADYCSCSYCRKSILEHITT